MSASVELLKAARAKIADPANWTACAAARTSDGKATDPWSEVATRWCAYGAIGAVRATASEEELLERVSLREFKMWPNQVNDQLGHAAVINLYGLTIDEAEASNA